MDKDPILIEELDQLDNVIHLAMGSMIGASLLLFLAVRCNRSKAVDAAEGRSLLQRLLCLEKPGDGLFACHELGRHVSCVISGSIFIFLLVPITLRLFIHIWSSIAAAVEKWEEREAFWVFMYAFGFVNQSLYEKVADSLQGQISIAAAGVGGFITINLLITLVGILRCTNRIAVFFNDSLINAVVCIGLLAPLSFIAVNALSAALVAEVESFRYHDALLHSVNWSTMGGQFPLRISQASVRSIYGICLLIYARGIFITITGLLIGLLGQHPFVAQIQTFLEGADEADSPASPDLQELSEQPSQNEPQETSTSASAADTQIRPAKTDETYGESQTDGVGLSLEEQVAQILMQLQEMHLQIAELRKQDQQHRFDVYNIRAEMEGQHVLQA